MSKETTGSWGLCRRRASSSFACEAASSSPVKLDLDRFKRRRRER